METNKPPFELTDDIVNMIAIINEKLGVIRAEGSYGNNLHLRKNNLLKTIQSTTAIENNTLSLKQVTDVINGKRVIGSQREIKEVKNAFEAYEHISEYDPYSIDSFLQAHAYLTDMLVKTSGDFRKTDVAVYAGDQVVHVGARPQFVYNLMKDLFKWAKNTKTHPLIVSTAVHYEIEFIHPFEDGNGRIGRLWQTLILSQWNELFAYIPVETIIYQYQQEYYQAINQSDQVGSSNIFIEFMLKAIIEALNSFDNMKITDMFTEIITDKLSNTEKEVLVTIFKYLKNTGSINNKKATELTGKSNESIKKYLNKFSQLNILIPQGENKGRKYILNKEMMIKEEE